MITLTSSFRETPFLKCFPSILNRKAGVFKALRLDERVFLKLGFCDGLVWTIGLTVEIKPELVVAGNDRRPWLPWYAQFYSALTQLVVDNAGGSQGNRSSHMMSSWVL